MSAPMKPCPGCGEPLREVGAIARAQGGCCGGTMYELCTACAIRMRTGNEAERREMRARIELALAEVRGEA